MNGRAYVLMNKKTGDLFEAYAVCFVNPVNTTGLVWAFSISSQSGWVIRHPGLYGDFYVFFNAEGVEKMFDVLGEL